MSRARDNANLGAQAGSGLDASDITTGVLPVGVTGGSGLNALSASNLSAGVVPDARMPNLTGDVTTVEGAVATTIGTNAITEAKIQANAVTGGKLANDIAISTTGNIATTSSGTITSAGIVTAPSLVLTPGSAPAETEGAMYYDSTSDSVKVRTGSSWTSLGVGQAGWGLGSSREVVHTYTSGGYTYIVHTFTSSDTFRLITAITYDAIIVGGGGGGCFYGGGGGGGAVIHIENKPMSVGSYSIVIGQGGTGDPPSNLAIPAAITGGTTTFDGYSATGGGGASGYDSQEAPSGGANSGGRGAYFSNTTGQPAPTSPSSQDAYDTIYAGHVGGHFRSGGNYPSGGGAGAGENGATPVSGSSNGGTGGDGVQIDIDGNNYFWGGGGGGAVYSYDSGNGGPGGNGGGGAGQDNAAGGAGYNAGGSSAASGDAIGEHSHGGANTGGGGGGSCYNYHGSASYSAGNGGSGIVIIRYAI